GRVVELRGTIDTRGDSLRATAQKIRVPNASKTNGASNGHGNGSAIDQSAVVLQFSPATTSEELREVRELLASSPGQRRVQLLFDRPSGEPLRGDAGSELRAELNHDYERKLMRRLSTAQSDTRTLTMNRAS